MKNNIIRSFKSKIILYTFLSLIATLFVEIFLIVVFGIITDFLINNGYRSYMFSRDGFDPTIKLAFLIAIGIITFVGCFYMLIRDTIKYITVISEGINEIAQGNLNTVIDVKGSDELAKLAENINRMSEEIIVIMERERESEKTKNELITSIAHDLRTPLTSIIGYLELLNQKPDLDYDLRVKYVDIVYNKSKRLEKLIYDLFDFAKLSHGKMVLKPSEIDVIKLLEQLLDEFYPSFMDNDLDYEYYPCVNGYKIEADGDLIARLFDNLVNNAIKYGKDGKLIRVYTQLTEDNGIRIDVINYGKVIPKADINKIFRRFYRVEQSRSENTGGTGLGLAIAKNIVDMHGGTIEVYSSLKGTIFSVKLYKSLDIRKNRFGV